MSSIDNHLFAASAVSSNDVWAVGEWYNLGINAYQTLIVHWDGNKWNIIPSPNVGSNANSLRGVAAISTNDVWAVGNFFDPSLGVQTLTMHWDGSQWRIVDSPNVRSVGNWLTGVTAVSSNNVWAVGWSNDGGGSTLTMQWNGTEWRIIPSPNVEGTTDSLAAVAQVSANDIWAVGQYSYTYPGPKDTLTEHWDGTAWSIISSPSIGSNNQLLAVSPVSSKYVWAVGYYHNDTISTDQTLIERWDGTSWSVVSSPNNGSKDNYLYGVAVVPGTSECGGDTWAVGYYGISSNSLFRTLVERYTIPSCSP